MRSGDVVGAKRLISQLQNQHPQVPKYHVLACRAALQDGDGDGAIQALDQARKTGANPHRLDLLALDIAELKQDWAALTEHASDMATRGDEFSSNTIFQVLLAFRTREDWSGLYTFCDTLIQHGPRAPFVYKNLYEALFLSVPPEARCDEIEKRIFGPFGGPDHLIAFLVYRDNFGRAPKAVLDLARRAGDVWPIEPSLKTVIAHLARSQPEVDAPHAQAALGSAPDILRVFGAALNPDWAEAIADRVSADMQATVLRRPLASDTGEDMIVSPEGRSGTTVLIFSDLMGQATLPVALLDSYFAARDVTAIYLRDKTNNLFLNGIAGLGPDLDTTKAELGRILANLTHHKQLVTMSTSAGGLAAVHYGLALGAARMTLFSPPSDVSPSFLAAIKDPRGRIIQRRLAKLPMPLLQIRPQLENCDRDVPVCVIYAQDSKHDRAHAEVLRGAKNVTLQALTNTQVHASMIPVLLNGQLDACLDALTTGAAHSDQLETTE